MTMTQTAQVIGTAQYLSPEQARGERVDARSDLYSTGCLLYELLTGRPPFTGDSPVAIAYQHVKEDPVPPSRVDPEVPAWADAIVLKAMEKDPAYRYQSAGEMRNDLQRALAGAPVAAPMQTQTYGSGTRRMGAATQTVGRTAAIPPYQYGPEQTGPVDDRPKRKVWPWVAVITTVVVLAVCIAAVVFLTGSSNGVPVPDVTGQSLAKAEAALTAKGFTIGNVTPRPSASVAKGDVISTNPGFGSDASKGSAIAITESSGPATVTLQSFLNEQAGQAEAWLRSHGLVPKVVQSSQAPADSPQGVVFNQAPPAGTALKPGATVTLYVPLTSLKMPDVSGDSPEAAAAALGAAPYFLTVTDANCPASQINAQPTGTVCLTSPAAGQPVTPHSAVTVFIEPAQSTSASSSPSPSGNPSPSSSGSPSPSTGP
jgi:serine/threonine-protein kinase